MDATIFPLICISTNSNLYVYLKTVAVDRPIYEDSFLRELLGEKLVHIIDNFGK